MESKPFDTDNIRDKNYFFLLHDLVNYLKAKKFKAGDKLPRESELALELNTNRSTLREMLRALEVLGIIDCQRGSANVYTGNIEVGFMNLFLISSILYDNKPYEFGNIRATIEASAIEMFIDQASDTDIFRLEILYEDKMRGNIDKTDSEYLEAHIAFHDTLMKYYDNETAKQLIRSNLRLIRPDYEIYFDVDPDLSQEEKEYLKSNIVNASHAKILDAVKKRDKRLAKELIIQHVFMTSIHKCYDY